MKDHNTENNHTSIKTNIFLLGCFGLILVAVLDILYWQTKFFEEGLPDFSKGHIIRSIAICISVIAIFWAFFIKNRPSFELCNQFRIHLERLSKLGTLSISIFFLLLFVFKPIAFNKLSLEDQIIEWGSALLLFSGCIFFFVSFLKSRRHFSIPLFTQLSLILLSLLLFLITMEEISWFQRLLDFKTPSMFKLNIQREMNLHNFATDTIENIYYFGTYLFFVVLPVIYILIPSLSNYSYLKLFIARPFIVVVGTIACAYNFDMWNISLTQISFFSSIVILSAFTIYGSSRNERVVCFLAVILIVITQVVFLMRGKFFFRIHEVTEYKEFFISLLLFLYSLDVYTYLKRVYLPKNR